MELVLVCDDGRGPSVAVAAALTADRLDGEVPADLRDIVAAHPGRRVLVVTTADRIAQYAAEALAVDPTRFGSPVLGSVTRIRGDRRGALGLIAYNDTLHLPAAVQTYGEDARR